MGEASTQNKENNLSKYDKVNMNSRTFQGQKISFQFLFYIWLARVLDIGQLGEGI